MRATVPYPVSPVDVDEDNVVDWINDEGRTVLGQGRAALNYLGTERVTCVTAGAGVFVRLWTSHALATNSAITVSVNVVGVSTSGAAQRAGYLLFGTFESTAAVVAQVSTTASLASHETNAGIDCRLVVDTTNRQVYLEARDNATSPMRFVGVVQVNEALLA